MTAKRRQPKPFVVGDASELFEVCCALDMWLIEKRASAAILGERQSFLSRIRQIERLKRRAVRAHFRASSVGAG